ncbi:MAG: hypothetical protein GY797_11015 [Deltaproteobacteria bacterium]|nr:hypothetical protein [Deltaproteobacteria bacterium]
MKKSFAKLTLVFLISLAVFAPNVCLSSSTQNWVKLFIPAFKGPDKLGLNVATILNLQIWQTLRVRPWPYDPADFRFGDGNIESIEVPLEEKDAIIKATSLEVLAQFVLMGEVFRFGDGIVVEAIIIIPEYDDFRPSRPEIWELKFPINHEKSYSFKIGLPNQVYEFAPVVLKQEFVEKYSTPVNIKIYKSRKQKKVIGVLGREYRGLLPYGNYEKVKSGAITGWVYLPEISTNRNEIADFTGGLIRIFRRDWEGADELLERVIKNVNTPSIIKADCFLYKAYAKERRGLSGAEDIKRAFSMNAYYRPTVEYKIMSLLTELKRKYLDMSMSLELNKMDSSSIGKVYMEIKNLVDSKGYLFPQKTPFLLKVKNFLRDFKPFVEK